MEYAACSNNGHIRTSGNVYAHIQRDANADMTKALK